MSKLERKKLDKSLHWTTFYSEKLLLAVIGAPMFVWFQVWMF